MKSFLEMIIREVIGAGILGLVLAPFMETEIDYLSLLILFLLVRIIDRALHWTGTGMTLAIKGSDIYREMKDKQRLKKIHKETTNDK